jgi:hypothetical protein
MASRVASAPDFVNREKPGSTGCSATGAATIRAHAMTKLTWRDVLCFDPNRKAHQATVRRFYLQYRLEQQLPVRCDNPQCQFHTHELVWNGNPLPLILDHLKGVRNDNRPKSLRLLCPNCDSQLATRGGKNKGRVQLSSAGFAVKDAEGKRHYSLVADTGSFKLSGGVAGVGATPGAKPGEREQDVEPVQGHHRESFGNTLVRTQQHRG